MTRSFLRPLSALFFLGIIPVGAACNGHVISVGNTGDTLQPVKGGVSAVAGVLASAPGSCPSGFAHPNICCSAGPNEASSCGAWEEQPFRACASGSTTYPDPLSCCDLSDPTHCIDTPSDAGPVAPPPPAYACGYACPPGYWADESTVITPEGIITASCCTFTDASSVPVCTPQNGVGLVFTTTCATNGSAPSGGTTPVTNGPSDAGVALDATTPPPFPVDAGTVTTEDGGVWSDDAGCETYDAGYPEGYDGGATSLCAACPPGWSPDSVQPELCCIGTKDARLCFSQATGAIGGSTGIEDGGTIPYADASAPTTDPSGGGWGTAPAESPDGGPVGPSCQGSDTTCSCSNSSSLSATYALDCYQNSSGTFTCSCTIDGKATGGIASVTSCQDSNQVENAYQNECGFQ